MAQPAALDWNLLRPDEQQVLQRFRAQWDDFSAERQHRLRKGADRWLAFSADQRSAAQRRLERWQELSRAERRFIRKRFRDFRKLPARRQARMLKIYDWYSGLAATERDAMKTQLRRMRPAERRRFISEHVPGLR